MLNGGAGNDTYAGGTGNDTLTDTATTASNDVYRWGTGQGNDSITDAGGTDRIEIGAGVIASQIKLTRATNDLQVSITGATDVLTIKNWYINTANRIEEIRLADGSVINPGTAAPLSITSAALSREQLQMQRTRDPSMHLGASLADDVFAADRNVHLLVQAMAQFGDSSAAIDTLPMTRRHDIMRVDLASAA